MLFLLFLPVVGTVALFSRYLQIYAPSNMLITRVRYAAPRWRTVLALAVLAVALLVAMHAVAQAIEDGAPAWLNLVVLVLGWDAIKLCLLAVMTVGRASLVRAKRVWRRFTGPKRTSTFA